MTSANLLSHAKLEGVPHLDEKKQILALKHQLSSQKDFPSLLTCAINQFHKGYELLITLHVAAGPVSFNIGDHLFSSAVLPVVLYPHT